MTDPYVFYRKKKGRKLILYLERKLVRKKWQDKGWRWDWVHPDVGSDVGALSFWNIQKPVNVLTCTVREDRPDVITCNDVVHAYNIIFEIVHGYSSSLLIEIVTK